MNDTLALIITSNTLPAKCFSIIRKYNPISIGEIKKRAISNLPILECDAIDHDGLNILLKCYSELSALGISVSFLDGGEPSSLELMYNLQKSFTQTEAEVFALIDEESE